MAALHLSADLVGMRTGAPTSNEAITASGTSATRYVALSQKRPLTAPRRMSIMRPEADGRFSNRGATPRHPA